MLKRCHVNTKLALKEQHLCMQCSCPILSKTSTCKSTHSWPVGLGLQNGESWNKVMHGKAHGAFNLDKASRRLATLEHFVMWSSAVASAGNEGM